METHAKAIPWNNDDRVTSGDESFQKPQTSNWKGFVGIWVLHVDEERCNRCSNLEFAQECIFISVASGNLGKTLICVTFNFHCNLRKLLILFIFFSGRGQASLRSPLLNFPPPSSTLLLLVQPWSLEHSSTRIIHTAIYHHIITPRLLFPHPVHILPTLIILPQSLACIVWSCFTCSYLPIYW